MPNGKKLCQGFEQLKAEYPEANVELWAIDEHRLGLTMLFRLINHIVTTKTL
jgi:hypothetical protein